MTLRELIAELGALTKAEKAEVVERLAHEIGDRGRESKRPPESLGVPPAL
jgi:hypothetical protein